MRSGGLECQARVSREAAGPQAAEIEAPTYSTHFESFAYPPSASLDHVEEHRSLIFLYRKRTTRRGTTLLICDYLVSNKGNSSRMLPRVIARRCHYLN